MTGQSQEEEMEQGSNVEVSPEISSNESSSSSSYVPEQSAPAEKMVTISQSKFNETIRHANARVAEKARAEERARYENLNQNSQAPTGQNSQGISQDEIRRIASEAAAQHHQEVINNNYKQQMDAKGAEIAQKFFSSLANADKNLYPNLENNIKNADFASMPEIVSLVTEMDETDGVMNEILENPTKIPVLRALAATQPALAKAELKRMAESIKLNQQAANAKMPREPLSQISPSTSVSMDDGGMSVSDFKKLFKSQK